jgi:hypothetical protein
VRLRLRTLEGVVRRLEDAVTDDQVMASTLLRIWRYEHASRLSHDKERHRMMLAREVHAGNPEVWPEVEELLHEEADYLRRRAEEWAAQFEPGERPRWERLLTFRG